MRPARQRPETTEQLLRSIRSILRRILEVLMAKLPAAASRRLQQRWEERAQAASERSTTIIPTGGLAAGGTARSLGVRIATRGVLIIGAMELLRRGFQGLTDKAIEATEALQEFSGPIAAGRARLEYQGRMDAARIARATQDSATRLLESQRRLADESIGIRIAMVNATNRLSAAWIEVKRVFTDMATKLIPGFEPPDEGDIPIAAIGQFLDDIAAGKFAGRKNWPPPGWKD